MRLLDSKKVVNILCPENINQNIRLESIDSEHVHINKMHIYTDRLFTKLTKEDEAAFLKLEK